MRSLQFLIVLALSSSCAARRSYELGLQHASAERWSDAVSAFEEAERRRPGLPGLPSALAEARGELVRTHLAASDAALSAGDWRACFDALDRAEAVQPGLGATHDRQPRCAEPLLAEVNAQLDAREESRAYALIQELAERLPSQPDLAALRAKARDLAWERASRMAELSAWVEALEALSVIDTFEPERSANTERLRHGLKTRWAEQLREQVKIDHDRGQLATAFVRQARAADLSGISTDRTQREQLRRELLDRFGLRVDLQIEGILPVAVHEALQGGLGERVPVAQGIADPAFALMLSAQEGSCGEQRHTEIGEVEVERGTEPYDNPEWNAAHVALTRLHERLLVEEQSLRATMASVAEHERTIARRTDSLRKATDDLDKARLARDQAHDLLQVASAEWSAAAQAFASGSDPRGAALEPARLAWADAEKSYRKSEDAISKAQRQHASAAEAVHKALQALAESMAESDRQQARLLGLRDQLIERRVHLEALPHVAYRPVTETLRYPIHTVTTRCTLALTIRERGAAPQRLEAITEASARTHGAIVEAGLAELPYKPPATRQELLDDAVADLASQVRDFARARAERWRQTQIRLAAQGRRSTDDTALARQLAVYFNQPESPPNELVSLLADVFGIEDPSLLLPEDRESLPGQR